MTPASCELGEAAALLFICHKAAKGDAFARPQAQEKDISALSDDMKWA